MAKSGVFPLVIALCAGVFGCSRAEQPSEETEFEATSDARPEEATLHVEQSERTLPVPLPLDDLGQQLRKAHETADAARTTEEKFASAKNLLSLYESIGTVQSPHLISVRQDLAARAAQLFLETSPSLSKESAERGLRLHSAPSVLRANLFLALADAEEALGNQQQAKKALMEALAINEELFESEMETP